ncbi:Serine/threonine kinase [Entamoeba marina]
MQSQRFQEQISQKLLSNKNQSIIASFRDNFMKVATEERQFDDINFDMVAYSLFAGLIYAIISGNQEIIQIQKGITLIEKLSENQQLTETTSTALQLSKQFITITPQMDDCNEELLGVVQKKINDLNSPMQAFIVFRQLVNNWCETEENIITFNYISDCSYDADTDWRGWKWTEYSSPTDYFVIQNDCCGENRTDTTQNYFTFYDTASSNKDFTFTYVSETSNGRAYLNLTFVPEYPEVPYNFVCEDMADGSIINFQDREADSGVYVVLNLYTKSIYFNVNNGSEHVRLRYGKTVPPFTLINGNATVQIYNQTVIDGCSFRYVGYGTQADSLPSTLGTYFEMKEICSLNGYQRMMICDKGIEDYEDCTCTYENFKYRNSYLDCYHLSEYRIIQFIPNQIQLPSERYWYSFSTTEESYVTVGRNENLTFTGEVVLPDYPIHFSGSVYFNNTLIISRSDVYYDIGDFYISSLQNNVDYDDAILFRGKPISQTTTDLNSMGIQQIGCGASTRRFVSSSSSIDCYDKLDLILSTDYDAGDDHRLWSSIKSQISLTSVTITGTSYIRVENECNFSLIEEVTISVDFTCKKLIISELTHITLVGDIYLSVDSIEFSGDITSKNLNTEAFIKVNSATFDISSALVVDFDSVSSVNCFEFASSTNYFSSDLSSIVDSQLKVYCELQSETYGDFLYQYCPCENDDCYITTTFTSIDFGSTKTLDYGYLLLDQSTSLLNVVYLHGLKATNILTATINSNREVSIDNVLCNSSYFTLETNCDAIVKPSSAISYKPQSLLTFSSESVNIYDIIETDTGSFVITSTVSSISITQLTEESSSILSVSSIPDNSNSIYRVIGLRVLRDISSPDYYCDEQAIISLPSSSSSVFNDICKELNLYERTCNKVDDGYVNENGDYDYTCPCHSTESDCKIIVGNNVNSMTVDSISDLTVSGSVTLTAYNQYFILRAVGSASDVIEIIGYDNVIFIDGIEGQKFIFSDVNMISIMNGNGVSSTKTNIAKTNTLKTATDLSIYLSSNSYCTEAYISTYFFSFITTYECVRCGGGEVNSDGTCDEKIDVELCTEYATSGICVSCEEGYYVQGYSIGYQTCSSCPSNCKKCTSDGLTVECILCDNGFEISNGRCVKSSTCSNGYIYGMCRTCDEYTYSTNGECNSCIDGCSLCGDNLSCDVCDIGEQYLIQSDNQCLKQTTASAVSSNEIIGCISGYYLQNGNCESCSIYGESCTSCNIYGCLECSNNTINIDGNCLLIPNCGNVVNNYCTGCGEKSFFNGIECLSCPTGCSSCTSETSCSNCEDDYWLEEDNLCYSTSETTLNIDGCIEIRNGRCIRCSSNMFLNERSCELCDSNCLTCDSFADYCLSCHSNFTIQKDSTSSYCIENEVLNSKCSQMMLSGTGCAICKDGYYRQETDCEECVDNYTMPEWYYNIISSCWDHQPLNRPNITQIVELIKNDFDEKNFE